MTLGILGMVVVSNVDNALRLVVYRRVSQIHPMITLVGAFAGVRAFGLAGLVIGPLIMSFALELFKLSRAAGTTVQTPGVAVAAAPPGSAARVEVVA
jgi:predicted PurR-regulated permease PerM